MPKTVAERSRLTFYLPNRLNHELRVAADNAGQPISTYLCRALEDHLKRVVPGQLRKTRRFGIKSFVE